MLIRSIGAVLFLILGLNLLGCGSSTAGNQQANFNSAPPAASGKRSVSIDSPDGVRLVGTFISSATPNSAAILLLHQWQSDRHSYDQLADRLHEKGFSVLSIDGRGFGQSIKRVDGKGVAPERSDEAVKAMLGDVDAAVEYLMSQNSVDTTRIGIIGASYGSSLAAIYAASHPRISAVAMLSPGINYFGNLRTEPAVAALSQRPLLMVAAEDDKESADAVRKLAALVDGSLHVEVIYPSGGHGTDLLKSQPKLNDLLETFFNVNLNR